MESLSKTLIMGGTRHRRGVDRINHALRQDKRFRECRVRGLRLMVGFDYLGENP